MSHCLCGCGQPTPLATRDDEQGRYRRGEPMLYLRNHHQRTSAHPSPRDAFDRYVDPGGADDCWEWQGACSKGGYGNVRVGGRQTKAHRLSYELANGPIPAGLVVRHSCDNPPCVNPNHLLVGTHGDNAQDKALRDRSMFGERSSTARLTASNVGEIRTRSAAGEPSASLAVAYDVSEAAIRHILAGRTWKRVERPTYPRPGFGISVREFLASKGEL